MAVLEAFVYDPLLNWRLIDSTLFVYLRYKVQVLLLYLKLINRNLIVILRSTM